MKPPWNDQCQGKDWTSITSTYINQCLSFERSFTIQLWQFALGFLLRCHTGRELLELVTRWRLEYKWKGETASTCVCGNDQTKQQQRVRSHPKSSKCYEYLGPANTSKSKINILPFCCHVFAIQVYNFG
jgi:hypothetical protein